MNQTDLFLEVFDENLYSYNVLSEGAFSSLFDKILKLFESIKNKIVELFNKLISLIKKDSKSSSNSEETKEYTKKDKKEKDDKFAIKYDMLDVDRYAYTNGISVINNYMRELYKSGTYNKSYKIYDFEGGTIDEDELNKFNDTVKNIKMDIYEKKINISRHDENMIIICKSMIKNIPDMVTDIEKEKDELLKRINEIENKIKKFKSMDMNAEQFKNIKNASKVLITTYNKECELMTVFVQQRLKKGCLDRAKKYLISGITEKV